MKNRVFLIGTLMIGAAAPIIAQDLPSVPQTLSLRDAIDLSLRHNPTFRQVQNNEAPASWAVRNAFASWLPTFTAASGIQYQGSGAQRFLSQEFRTSPTIGSFYNLGLNWNFSGRTLVEPGRQRAAGTAVTASIDASRMNTQNAIVQQYVAILEAEAQVDLTGRRVIRDEENRRLAQARYDVGQTTMLDVRQAQVAKGQSDVALLQAEQRLKVEKLRLFQQMGVNAPSDLSVVTLSDSFPVVEPTFTLDELLADADSYNPNVMQLRAQETSAKRNATAAKTEWLPSLNLNARWFGFTQQFTDVNLQLDRARERADGNVTNCNVQNQIFASSGLPPADCAGLAFSPTTADAIRAQNSVFPFNFTQQPFNASLTV